MQKQILKRKNQISLISLVLIVFAFASKYTFENNVVFNRALIVASVIGVMPIAIQAYQALKVKVISIDVLVTIAVIGAFIIKNYEESAIVTFLFLFGAFLEQRTIRKTRSAIKELTNMAPETALKLMPSGEFEEIDVDDVLVGDTLLVKTGAKVPVDGSVITGTGYINEASITGESLPVEKQEDTQVFAGTILENGTLTIRAEKIGEDTTFGKIIELVEEAQDSKSTTERFIDKFSKYYTPIVLLIGLAVGIIFKDVSLAVTILVLGCPGALVIGVPVSNVAGIGNGAKNGILIKGSEVVNNFSKVNTIVFDKTGTLTAGNPEVSFFKEYSSESDKALNYLLSIEKESDHPLAKAVVEYVKDHETFKVDKTEVVKGGGIVASVNGARVVVGNLKLMELENIIITAELQNDVSKLEENGNSIIITAVNDKVEILMGVKDQVRKGVNKTLKALKKLGVKNLIMLSGDNQKTVDIVSSELGLTKAIGNMLPEDKANYIKNLQKNGHRVAFVGDGVNDSPSIAISDVGIAMGGGTDVAIETSEIVLMNSNLNKLPHAYGLSMATANNMLQNIIISVGVVITLLLGVLFSSWMNMSVGMLVHEASILVVILNGMRLLKYKVKNRFLK